MLHARWCTHSPPLTYSLPSPYLLTHLPAVESGNVEEILPRQYADDRALGVDDAEMPQSHSLEDAECAAQREQLWHLVGMVRGYGRYTDHGGYSDHGGYGRYGTWVW